MSTVNEHVVVEFFRAFDRLDLEGAFEIRAGKIAVWRDYYDMASFHKQLSES